LLPQIRSIKQLCVPSKTEAGDGLDSQCNANLALSALVIAVDMVLKYCRNLKYIKNIVVITDGQGHTYWTGVEDVANKINTENMNLSILYI